MARAQRMRWVSPSLPPRWLSASSSTWPKKNEGNSSNLEVDIPSPGPSKVAKVAGDKLVGDGH